MSTNLPRSKDPTETSLHSHQKVTHGRFKTISPQGRPTTYARRDKLDRRAITNAQVALEATKIFKDADDASKQKMKDDVENEIVDKRKKEGLHVSCMFFKNRRPTRPLDDRPIRLLYDGKVDEEGREVLTDDEDGNDDDDDDDEEEEQEEKENEKKDVKEQV